MCNRETELGSIAAVNQHLQPQAQQDVQLTGACTHKLGCLCSPLVLLNCIYTDALTSSYLTAWHRKVKKSVMTSFGHKG